MDGSIHFGQCARCGCDLKAPSFSTRKVEVNCPQCDSIDTEDLSAARAHAREAYSTLPNKDLALVLTSNAGQYVTALLSGERAVARSFLVNVIAVGELLLADL